MKYNLLNILANYSAKLWSIASNFLFIPAYIHILGHESYGLIVVHATIIAFINIADAGLSPTFTREVARNKSLRKIRLTLYTLERIYILIITLIIACSFILNSYITENAINSNSYDNNELELYVILMIVSAAFQMSMSIYRGGLMGANKQVLANSYQVLFSLLRSGFILIPLYFFPSLMLYFFWQVIISAIFVFIYRYTFWNYIGRSNNLFFSFKIIKGVWKFSIGMFGVAIISAFNMQIDKAFITAYFTLKDLAAYSIYSIAGQIPYTFTLPIAISIYPTLTKLVNNKDGVASNRVFLEYSFIIALLAALSTIPIYLYSEQLIFYWTRDTEISNNSKLITPIIVIGSYFLALQLMPYHLLLSHGHSRTNFIFGIVFMLVSPILLMLTIDKLGIISAAIPWCVLNIVGALVLTVKSFISFIKGLSILKYIVLIITPLIITSSSYYISQRLFINWFLIILSASFISIITCSIIFWKFRLKRNEN